MPSDRRQSLPLSHALTLVGSAAVGLAVYQYACQGLFRGWFAEPGWEALRRWNADVVIARLSRYASLLIPFVAAWTLALPLLGARPPWRRAWRQPGMSACLAAVVGWLWGALVLAAAMGLSAARPHRPAGLDRWLQTFLAGGVFRYVGLAVAATWAAQLLGGGWRRPESTYDRLGRMVGVSWILVGLIWSLREYFDLV